MNSSVCLFVCLSCLSSQVHHSIECTYIINFLRFPILELILVSNCVTARNLYQLNANEIPLTLHYGFEGHIIILHKNPYRWRLQNNAKGMEIFCQMTLMLIEKSFKSVQIAGGALCFDLS